MDKFDVTRFTDSALKAAGRVYMTSQDIKTMREKQKREEEKFKLTKAQGEAEIQSQALEGAMAFHKIQHPEKYVKPGGVEEKGRAEVLAKMGVIYSKDPATWTPAEKSYVKNMAPYMTRRKTDVTGMPGAGGKGGATTGHWLTAQRANVDDRANIINKMRGKLSLDPNIQIFIDAAGELDATTRYEDIAEIYNKAKAKIEEASKEKASPWVDTAKKDLEEYIRLTDWRIYYEMKIGGVPKTTKETPTTEIQIFGAGEGAPDEVQMMDDIIKGIK